MVIKLEQKPGKLLAASDTSLNRRCIFFVKYDWPLVPLGEEH